jgi:hypothetical protein
MTLPANISVKDFKNYSGVGIMAASEQYRSVYVPVALPLEMYAPAAKSVLVRMAQATRKLGNQPRYMISRAHPNWKLGNAESSGSNVVLQFAPIGLALPGSHDPGDSSKSRDGAKPATMTAGISASREHSAISDGLRMFVRKLACQAALQDVKEFFADEN